MEKKIGNLFKGDKGIWTVFLFLCLISVVEVFSASSTLTYKTHNYLSPLIYHCVMILLGVVVAIVTLNIPCRYSFGARVLMALTVSSNCQALPSNPQR